MVWKKAPEVMGFLALLLDRCGFRVCQAAAADLLERTRTLVKHPGDALVLAEAWTEGMDYFVTLDEKHFLKDAVLRKSIPFILGSPGDFLSWYRQRLVCETGSRSAKT